MEASEKIEWMEENDLRPGRRWVSFENGFDWEYDVCDIKTVDGREFGPCSPCSGYFTVLSRDDEEIKVPFSEVVKVKYYKSTVDETGEDGEQEDEQEEF